MTRHDMAAFFVNGGRPSVLKKALYAVLRASGLPFLFREVVQKHRVTILLFHDIGCEAAERAFAYLAKHYNLIGLDDYVDACASHTASRLPEKALIITFDDGRIGNYALLPVIRQQHVPVTIFVCTSIVGTNRHYWFLHAHDAGLAPDKEFEKPEALQRAQLDAMKPYVNLQSHTMFHPVLPKCSDGEARAEIFDSKRILEEDYGLRVNAISYPHGNYSERDIALTREAGYRCGLTVDYGYNTLDTDPFRLKRLCVNDTDDLNELIVKASGVWQFFRYRNGRRQGYGLMNGGERPQ